MRHLIYLTSGSYSDFSVGEHYEGPVPWGPVLDAMVLAETDKVKTWSEVFRLDGKHFPELADAPKKHQFDNPAWRAAYELKKALTEKAVLALLAAGYEQVEAEEVAMPY